MHYEEALRHCIFKFTAGSHQYGTNRPESDIDKRGVFIAPLTSAFQLFQTSFVGTGSIRQHLGAAVDAIEEADFAAAKNHIDAALQTDRGDLTLSVETVHLPGADEELHELRKFFKLASECNPNIIEYLFIDDLIDICTPEWEIIKAHRNLFLSKKARWTFAGYCMSQLKRIKLHRGYLMNPPSHQPTRPEFSLPLDSKIPKEHLNAILSLPDEWVADNAKEQVLREKQYASALQIWQSYKKWERERNPARRELERQFGYDTKHSMHLLRLSRMCKEILRDGRVIVRRPDAEELRGVLRGEWKYEDIIAEAEKLDTELDVLYKKSKLQESPDRKGIADLYNRICEERYGITLH